MQCYPATAADRKRVRVALARASGARGGSPAGTETAKSRSSRENRLRHRRLPELAKAIKAVAEGNIASNTLRRIASLSGGSGPQRAVQDLLRGGGLGYALGGPAGAAIGAGIALVAGQVAGRMAERAARRRANLARAMAARGETPAEARKAAKDMSLAELTGGLMETRR